MIRFIDLGRQIAVDETDPAWPRQFAFFDTIPDQFIKIEGYVVFDSLADLIEKIELDESLSPEFANRLLRLCPDWVTTVKCDNPRSSFAVTGLDDPRNHAGVETTRWIDKEEADKLKENLGL